MDKGIAGTCVAGGEGTGRLGPRKEPVRRLQNPSEGVEPQLGQQRGGDEWRTFESLGSS